MSQSSGRGEVLARSDTAGAGPALARGSVGGRPVYYRVDGEGAPVASARLSDLLVEGRGKPDPFAVASLVADPFPQCDRTGFANLRKLRAGESLEMGRSGPTVRTAELRRIAPSRLGAADAAAALLEAMRAAVGRALSGHRKVAIAAGGGVDSSALVALALEHARRHGGPDVEVITLDFACEGDDRPHMRALSAALGFEPIRVRPSDFRGNLRRAMVLDANPVTHPTATWDLGILELARDRGATALLAGAGGDALFDGDTEAFGRAFLHGDLGALLQAARLRVTWTTTAASRVREFVARPIVRALLPEGVLAARRRRYEAHRMPGWMAPRARELLVTRPAALALPREDDPTGRFARFARSVGLQSMCDGLAQLEVTAGIPLLTPFLDEELVAFVASLDPRLLFHGGRVRGLFREALHGKVPDSVRLRMDKASFNEALAEVLAAAGGLDTVEDLADVRVLSGLGLVDGATFAAEFRRCARTSTTEWTELWPTLAGEAFARVAFEV